MKTTLTTTASFLLISLLVACAPKMHPEIERADSVLASARATYSLEENAPRALKEAENAVERAKTQWRKDPNETQALHLSYVAARRIQIAAIVAQQKQIEMATQKIYDQQASLVDSSRKAELKHAKREAEVNKTRAEIYKTRAAIRKAEVDILKNSAQ